MANAVIDVYDQELSPTVQSLLDVGSSRAAFVDNDILWVGSSAIADGSTYRFELRQLGAIGSYSITSLPNPNIVAAFQLNDANGYIGAIAKTSEGDILFQFKAASAANTKVYRWTGVTLSADDAPSTGLVTPALKVLKEEAFACYTSKIRRCDANDTWADMTVTPAPTSYNVRGIHQLGDKLYFLVDADYSGTPKAEVWIYSTGDAAITLEKSYTGVSSATWNRTYVAGGVFNDAIYASWNESSSTHTLVTTTGNGSWSTAKASLQMGQIVEHRGSIFGQYNTTLYSPATSPSGTWATISASFNAQLVVF